MNNVDQTVTPGERPEAPSEHLSGSDFDICRLFGTLAECRKPSECTRRECGNAATGHTKGE